MNTVERFSSMKDPVKDPSHNSTNRVLVIEDDPASQILIKNQLRHIDKQISLTVVASVEDFELLAEHPEDFNLIISDLYLGEGSTGLQFWRQLKAQNSEIPFLITSGLGQNEFGLLIDNDKDAPSFIQKPHNRDEFKASVTRLMQNRMQHASDQMDAIAASTAQTHPFTDAERKLLSTILLVGMGSVMISLSGPQFVMNRDSATSIRMTSVQIPAIEVTIKKAGDTDVSNPVSDEDAFPVGTFVPAHNKIEAPVQSKSSHQFDLSKTHQSLKMILKRADHINGEASRIAGAGDSAGAKVAKLQRQTH